MPQTARDPSTRPTGWLPGLDGLRAMAVIAVMVFHFAPDLLPGGFLGVDLFFAISGYLITRLLLLQMYRTGRVDLLGFYRRRWRRLFPAVAVLLVVVTLAAVFIWPDELATLREGVLASAGFVTNWWLIFDHQSYFVAVGRPPMVQHLWSLAIEEQFYLIWPLVLAVLVGLVGRPRRDGSRAVTPAALLRVAAAGVGLGVGSALLMNGLAVRDDVPYGADSARVYFGTDTHASGLLFGAALGALSLWRVVAAGDPSLPPPRERSAGRARLTDAAGRWSTDALAVVALLLLAWQVHHLTEFDPALYRGGFAVVSLLAAVLVASVARPGSRIGALLDAPLLRWLGQRSYAMYLWHWPVAVVTRPGVDITGPRWLLVGNQVAITVVLAAASYRFVEQPFRTGAVSRWLAGNVRSPRRIRPSYGFSPWRRLAAWALAAAAIATAVSAAETGRHPAVADPAPASAALTGAGTSIDTIGTARPTASPSGSRPAAAPSRSPGARGPAARTAPKKSTSSALVPMSAQPISGFGDSVMLGAAPALVADLPRMRISAIEGRQARSVFADVESRRVAGTLASIVVIHTGDNGIISAQDLRTSLRSLADRRLVVLLTARVPREWQGPNNGILKKTAAGFKNVRVVDWYARSNGHPSWFYDDGLHLRPVGAAAYAALVRAALH